MSREISTVAMLGLVAGLQAALLAIGLVLVYQAQRFVNFAQAQLGLVAASTLGVLVLRHEVPYIPAVLLAVAVGVASALLVERLLRWRLADASPTTLVIATIGISQLLMIVATSGPLAMDPSDVATKGYPLPFRVHLDIGGYTLNTSEVVTIAVAPALVIALQLFITRTRLGTSIRGIASNREAAALAGISIRRTSVVVWAVAGLISSIAAVLYAPSQPPGALGSAGTGLLLPGLAAALAGGLSDYRLTALGGVLLGLVQQAVLFWVDTPGASDLAVFMLLVIIVAARSGRLPTRSDVRTTLQGSDGSGPYLPRWVTAIGWSGLGCALLALPLLPGLRSQEKALLLTLIIVYAITGLSLLVLTGWAGQVSLGQFAFVGVGAFVSARLFAEGLSAPIVLLDTGLITAAITVAVGLPALRLGRFFTAIITLGFAFVAQSWLFRQEWFTGEESGYVTVDVVHILGTEITSARGTYSFALVVLLVSLLLLRSVRASSIGRALIAVRDNPDRVASDGISPTRVKIYALALSGFLAGLAGTVWAMATRQWSFDSFDPTTGLLMLSAVIVGSLTLLAGPIVGALAVYAWPFLVPGANTFVVRSFAGGALLLVVLLFAPEGLVGLLRRRVMHHLGTRTSTHPAGPRGDDEHARIDGGELVCAAVTKRFGGIAAVDGASVHVGRGEVVGLMGGNGAGKTTLVDCISGRQLVDGGAVHLNGIDVTHWPPARRASAGVARTYQDAALFTGLSVRETLLVAVERTERTGAISASVSTPWAQCAERQKTRRVQHILDEFGLTSFADQLTSELSTGMRRICELAAAVVPSPSLILLDEPAAGLAQREVEALGERIVGLRDRYGMSILIVEHDIPLLTRMCDRLYCMEQGAVLAEGDPASVIADPRVIASCLGTDVTAIERSGTDRARAVDHAPDTKRRRPLRAASSTTRGAASWDD